MHKKNAEICHCGWLVKSPPNYRGSIFKAVSILIYKSTFLLKPKTQTCKKSDS